MKIERPSGKTHCYGDQCDEHCYSEGPCDCSCSSRCGPWNDYLEAMAKQESARAKLREVDPVYQEALAVHEVYRKLGFSADHIYLEIATSGGTRYFKQLCVYMKLAVPGRPEFTIEIGKVPRAAATVEQEWLEAIEAFCASPEEDARIMFEQSKAGQRMAGIALSIRAKGIPIPKLVS